jgi:hypothetical protein
MPQEEEHPVEIEESRGQVKITHPAYAMISASRFNGGESRFFGSDLKHREGVSIRIKTAYAERSLSHDWYYEKEPLIEIKMSEAQWAKFVSSMNAGATPATLTLRRTGDVEYVPQILEPTATKKEIHEEELKRTAEKYVRNIQSRIEELETLISSKSGAVSKKELQRIVSNMKIETKNLPENMGYAVKCFSEMTEKLAEYAKIELDSYLTQTQEQFRLKSDIEVREYVKKLTKENQEENRSDEEY